MILDLTPTNFSSIIFIVCIANLFAFIEECSMNISENKLREFETTLKEIRATVLSDSGLFADLAFRKATRILAFGFGAAIAVFCALGYFAHGQGAGSPLPSAMIWIAVAVVAVGACIKVVTFSRIMRQKNKTIFNLLKIIYGKSPVSLLVAVIAAIAVSTVFLISRGEGVFAVSFSAIFIAFGVFALIPRIRLPEFTTLGWFLFAGGLLSLFMIEDSPWIWGGMIWGGAFCALGIASLLCTRKK